jgi:hypothetical protein
VRRAIRWVYGEGFAAFVAAAIADRAISEVRRSTRKEPEMLDVSRLRPGETYLVTTRPAPTRRERRLERRSERTHERLALAERPSRKLREAERELNRAQRRLDRSKAGSRKERKATAEVLQRSAVVSRLRTPSKKVVRLRLRATALDGALVARQEREIARARKSARPPRRHRFD